MTEVTFEVTVPPALVQFGFNRDHVQRNVNEWLVLSLFTDNHISSGKAARLLDISRIDFLALLRKRGMAYIDYSQQELAEEFDAVKKLEIEKSK
jgi:predicted HTH domain antitoxin